MYLLQRVRNLFVFGQYKNISSDTALLDAKGIFDDRLKVISQCSKYSAIPYMIDKKQKFSDFASYDNAMRAYNAITSSGGKDDEQICLLYWGLVFLALLNKEVNPLVRDYFLTLSDETHIKTKGIFSRYKEATKESNSVRN